MCGIAGLLTSEDGASLRTHARTMACLDHRGPDARGWLQWDGTAFTMGREGPPSWDARLTLLFTRLAILDLTDAGNQPMASPDGRYRLIYNGEVYNYRELATELEALGHIFRGRSDTEVLLAAWSEWGSACLPRLTGMFAFCMIDTLAGTMTLARDPFGIKPLYYTRLAGGLAFASEIKALLGLPGVCRRANPQRLFDYLRFGLTDHGDQTMFAGIAQVPAAHALEIPLDDPAAGSLSSYWRLVARPDLRADLSLEEAAAGLRERFIRNVQIHLRSDVPVGAALSGGIDSSAIVMAMREVAGPNLDVHTFSYVADDRTIGEEHWVDMVGQAAKAVLHKVRLGPGELTHDLERLIACQDEPFASTSIYAQFRVFREAREAGITVMLDGQGADELLGGYRPFVAARLASCLRGGELRAAAHLARSAARQPGEAASRIFLQSGGYLVPWRLERPLRQLVGADLVPPWMNRVWFERQGVTAATPWLAEGPRYLCTALERSVVETSLPMLLRYEDRNSMAHSIESRLPFLTTDLADYILSLPEHYLIANDGTSKCVFRKAMQGLVPDAILQRRDKIGFATPERHWLKELTPWVEGVLASEAAAEIPVLNMARVRRTWRALRDEQTYDESPIWRWVNLIKWVEQFNVTFAP